MGRSPVPKTGCGSYGLYLSLAVIIILILQLFFKQGGALGGRMEGTALVLGCSFGAVDVWLYAKLKKKAD